MDKVGEFLQGVLGLAISAGLVYGIYLLMDRTVVGEIVAIMLEWVFDDDKPGPCGACEPVPAF